MRGTTIFRTIFIMALLFSSCLIPEDVTDYKIPKWLEGEWESGDSRFIIGNNNITHETGSGASTLTINYQGRYGSKLEVRDSSNTLYYIWVPEVDQEFTKETETTFSYRVGAANGISYTKSE